ncbi:MAG: type III-A CRISPR-associated RAMP protein Csm3 [Sphingobacteriales bacterium]|nr:type III-A CRISPR-associated RAMP protein Csm3 [Sphingobacteriales bacterium]
MKLYQKIILNGTLECVTGLHIGDSKENAEIGGVDAPVIRRKDNRQPYIPGSSLKGKIRCLLEQVAGENANSKSQNNGSVICQLFGASENKPQKYESCQSRLIVRDAYMTPETVKLFSKLDTELQFTEIKFENSINRIKGTADSPRQFERVPAGAIFNVEFVINVFADTKDKALLEATKFIDKLKQGVDLLNQDYLGGSGSRGYGQVCINLNFDKPSIKDYANA